MANTRIRIQHNSMQFSDSNPQHAHDAKALFDHAEEAGVWVVTGTESGAAKANHDLQDALIKEAKTHGYSGHFHKYGDWVAMSKKFMKRFEKGYEGPFIPGTKGVSVAHGSHSPRGITWMQGEAKDADLGRITVGSCHFLTQRSIQVSGNNDRLVKGIKAFGSQYGRGRQVAFLCADANTNDKRKDVFSGIAPFTSIADELGKYPATHEGGGIIDVIASYDSDGRVSGKSYHVLTDAQLNLNSDHLVLEAGYEIKAKGTTAKKASA